MAKLNLEIWSDRGGRGAMEQQEIVVPEGYREWRGKEWKKFLAENIDKFGDAVSLPVFSFEIYEGSEDGIDDIVKIEVSPVLTPAAVRNGLVKLS